MFNVRIRVLYSLHLNYEIFKITTQYLFLKRTYFAFMLKYIRGLKAEFAMASQKKARKTCCVYL